jgi:muramoyltetrapeptide carboxypeptidase
MDSRFFRHYLYPHTTRLQYRCGIAACYHANHLSGKHTEAIQSLKAALFGETLEYTFPAHALNRNGNMQGEIVGGNLSILYSNLGTKTILDTNKKILLLEDLDEYLYHIDRMMMAMKRAGKLQNLAGLVVGGLSDMKDNTIPFGKTAEEIIAEHVAEYDYPVCFNFPSGHISDNRAVFMGKQAKVEVGDHSIFVQ